MKVVFFYPPVNKQVSGDFRWVPLRTPILENYVRLSNDSVECTHFDLEREFFRVTERKRWKRRLYYLFRLFLRYRSIDSVVRGRSLGRWYFDFLWRETPLTSADLFCFSFYRRDVYGTKSSLLFMRYVKQKFPQAKVVVGGFYGADDDTVLTQLDKTHAIDSLSFVDYYVPRYGERPLLKIIKAEAEGDRMLAGDLLEDIEQEPLEKAYPDYSSFCSLESFSETPQEICRRYTKRKKIPSVFLQEEKVFLVPYFFQRGCFHARCAYCGNFYSEKKNTRRFYYKNVATVVDDLKRLKAHHQSRHFIFFNTNFNFSLDYAKKLLSEMIRARLDIVWADSFNLRVMDDELVELLVAAGCYRLDIGLVSFNEQALKKNCNIIDDLAPLEWLEKLTAANLWTHCNFIAGLPHDLEMPNPEAVSRFIPFIDSYVINKFRLYYSGIYREAAAFGVSLTNDRRQCFVEKSFSGSLDERRKVSQSIYRSLAVLLGRDNGIWRNFNDLQLVSYLYYALGHKKKEEIREMCKELLVFRHKPLVQRIYNRFGEIS